MRRSCFVCVFVVAALVAVQILTPQTLAAAAPSERAATIALRSQTLDIHAPTEPPARLAASAAAKAAESVQLVKFPAPPTAAQLTALERGVDRIYTYLPHDAFLVRVSPHKAATLDAPDLGLAWRGAYHPAYKVSPSLAEASAVLTSAKAERSARANLMVHVFPDADLDAFAADVEGAAAAGLLGAAGSVADDVEVLGVGAGERFARLRLRAPAGSLVDVAEALALESEVFWVEIDPRRGLYNDTTVWVAQSGLSGGQQTPVWDRGVLGEGQIVGVLDTGIDIDMCYFRDGSGSLPPTNPCNGGTLTDPTQRKVIAVDFLWGNECSGGISSSEWDSQDHGSHVAGTVAGDDLANPLQHDAGDGMAPGAKLVVQDCGFRTDNCADCPGIGACPVVDLNPVFQQAFDQGARIHTNSWGDDENNPVQGLYSAGSEDADEFMWNNPDFLLVFAAGNSGPGSGTVGSPSTAKSVVSVGATLRSTSANSMASFSSCGPTDDGRIKPDVTMPGSGIISANNDGNINTNNCNTKSSSGTSMAAPGAAGSLALIRQYFTDGFYPSGAANAGDAFTPSAALLKATLVNTSVNMTGTAAIPSNCQGWGRVLLDDALAFTGDARKLFLDDDRTGFPNGGAGQTRTFDLAVASSSEPLKVTLNWSDFPSTPAASSHLVNDLDLEVTGPSGTYRGNVFSGGVSTTGGSFDRLNNLEQVLIPSPTAGTYTVTVRAFTVPNGPQPFALVATGDLGAADAPSVAITAPSDGTVVTQGASVTFNGTASDPQDGDLSSGIAWSSSRDGALGSGASIATSSLSVGTHTVTASVTDSDSNPGSAAITLTVQEPPPEGCLHQATFEAGTDGWQTSGGCATGAFVVGTPDATTWQVGGAASGVNALFTQPNPGGIGTDDVDGGTCEARSPSIDASAETAVEVKLDYFHGQRDAGDDANDGFVIDVLDGGVVVDTIVAIGDVTNSPAWTTVSATIPSPGANLQVRVRATDATGGGDIVEGGVDSVTVCPVTPATCTVNEDFESGSAGWSNSPSSTCSTGAFVEGNPTLQTNGGVTTQVGGSRSGTASLFTATNTSAGSNDVDSGTCILDSPTWSVSAASTLSVWTFHGQRDAGDDSGDFFRLEMSTDGGSTWSTVTSNGDTTSNATWTESTAAVPAGSNVTLRVQCTDGPATGDLVECGIDDVSICTN
ncbi:MAG: S8 family serine peptidase [Acidobacteriota bacterium]